MVRPPVPRALLCPMLSVPPLRVVPPEYVLLPDSVSVPVPVLLSAPVPDMTPEKAVLVLSPPTVRLMAPPVCTAPAPANEPMDWLLLPAFHVAPEATVSAAEADSAFAAVVLNVPAEIVVAPVKLLAPLSTSVPAPVLVRPPVPLIAPLCVAVPVVTLRVVDADRAMALAMEMALA